MPFDYIIANPSFDIGNKIITETLNYLTKTGKASVLMPLYQYKRNNLYKHIEVIDIIDSKIFEGAIIQRSLCEPIATLKT